MISSIKYFNYKLNGDSILFSFVNQGIIPFSILKDGCEILGIVLRKPILDRLAKTRPAKFIFSIYIVGMV